MQLMGTRQARLAQAPESSSLCLGILKLSSTSLPADAKKPADTATPWSVLRSVRPNLLLGTRPGVAQECRGWLGLGVCFVTAQTWRLKDILARRSRLAICPGGWAAPQ